MKDTNSQILTLLTAQEELTNLTKDFIKSEEEFKFENPNEFERYRHSMWCWLENLETSIKKFKDGLV